MRKNKVEIMNDVHPKIKQFAESIKSKILSSKAPVIEIPIRSLNNVEFNKQKGHFTIKGRMKKRVLAASTSRSFAQTMRMLSLAKQLIESDDIATKRDAYYTAYNWLEAGFKSQQESDEIMDDIEAMLFTLREKLGFIPDEKGGDVVGKLVVIDEDEDKNIVKVDCSKMGTGAFSVPNSVEKLKFETKAKFVLAVETSGMFQRLVKHKFWDTAQCILISLSGVPTRAARRFVRRLSDEMSLPVYVFTDGDPYGWLNIYRTLKVGSGNAAHLNEFFCAPRSQYIGVTAQDIIDFDLPTHPLKEVDIKRLQDGLKNDPFVHAHKDWQQNLKLLLKLKKRAEQQALAKHGLNYVITDYLPKKLADHKTWLS
jgi:DNA topoisomerase-6 subunit A